jgi:hypothetical protein
MKTKFLLTLIAFCGLIFSTNSASAATKSTIDDRDITSLSQTISHLINLDPADRKLGRESLHSLVEAAINRALLAKEESNSQTATPTPAGGISIQSEQQPIINGKIANPRTRSTTTIKVDRPLINGIIRNDNSQTTNSSETQTSPVSK